MKNLPSFKILTFIPATGVALPYIAKDVISALQELNQQVLVLDLKDFHEDQLRIFSSIEEAIIKYKPDFIFTLATIVLYSELYIKYKIPYLSWFTTDPKLWLRPNSLSEYYYIFVCSKEAVSELKAQGFKNTFYLPLCTNPKIFKKLNLENGELERYRCDISFVGTYNRSIGFRENRDFYNKFLTPSFVQDIIKRQSENPNEQIRNVFAEALKDKFNFQKGISAIEKYVPNLEAIIAALEYEAMVRYRREVIDTISNFGINLYGDSGWREIRHPKVKYRGWIDNRQDLPRLYNATKINLNLSVSSMKDALNISSFNIPACSSFMLSNFREDLVRLFREGDEVVYFRDKKDLKEKVDYYLRNDKEREEIAKRAQRRILTQHTFVHRMEKVLRIMERFLFFLLCKSFFIKIMRLTL
ncbi:MAG: glycosyltransferase [bacterium]|nr:glycosyltransferase [bacterium]